MAGVTFDVPSSDHNLCLCVHYFSNQNIKLSTKTSGVMSSSSADQSNQTSQTTMRMEHVSIAVLKLKSGNDNCM